MKESIGISQEQAASNFEKDYHVKPNYATTSPATFTNTLIVYYLDPYPTLWFYRHGHCLKRVTYAKISITIT